MIKCLSEEEEHFFTGVMHDVFLREVFGELRGQSFNRQIVAKISSQNKVRKSYMSNSKGVKRSVDIHFGILTFT